MMDEIPYLVGSLPAGECPIAEASPFLAGCITNTSRFDLR